MTAVVSINIKETTINWPNSSPKLNANKGLKIEDSFPNKLWR